MRAQSIKGNSFSFNISSEFLNATQWKTYLLIGSQEEKEVGDPNLFELHSYKLIEA